LAEDLKSKVTLIFQILRYKNVMEFKTNLKVQ